jgi:hypothetical protein
MKQLSLSGKPLGDESAELLAGLPQLAALRLGGTAMTDEGLVRLAPLTHLQELILPASAHDQSIYLLRRFPRLRSLAFPAARQRRRPWHRCTS